MSLVALGVTGGIGAYKAVEIARLLQKSGHDVVAIMTRAARTFVGPVTFEAITRHRVITSQWEPGTNADIEHIALAPDIGLLLIAPATANIIGKMAAGVADDFLTSLYLATRAPVMIAPAMNTNMWEHAAVQQNLRTLAERGVLIVEPGVGFLACGWEGKGRLAEPEEVVAAANAALRPAGTLTGRRILVTAGPTYEDLDPVRYIGNRSSGKMGFAVAAEAAKRGAQVTLVAGPTQIGPPEVAEVVRVRSAREMHAAVVSRASDSDAIVMAAAVADYTPEQTSAQKVPKATGPLTLTLVRTPDILGELGALRSSGRLERTVLVGFAAETIDVVERAREKRRAKHADLIVANDVSKPGAGFDADNNLVTLVDENGEESLPLLPKTAVARAIIDRLESLIDERMKEGASRESRD
jgi:phosphopantothenoylcysteine decarboxylase/phosphopantothenate--cysteine ligase